MRGKQLASIALSGLLIAACAGAGDTAPARSEADRRGAPVDVSVLRTAAYDNYVFATLAELAASEPVVVTGVVRGFAAGHAVLTWRAELNHYGVQEPHVVMQVEVSEAFKGASQVFEGHVYVSISRGAEVITESGEPDRPPGARPLIRSIDEFRAAIPAGTQVALLVRPKMLREQAGEAWVGWRDGRPPGATLLYSHPQGLIFENGLTGLLVCGYVDLHTQRRGWMGLRMFDDLVRRLRALFAGG